MKMRKIFVGLLSLCFSLEHSIAQDEITPINTGAANFLTLMTNARSAGMGGVYIPENNDAVFQNGAMAAINPQKGGLTYSFSSIMRCYESGHSLNSVAGFYKLSRYGVVLGGFRYYHYPEVIMSDYNTDISYNIRPKEWAIDLGYAYEIIPQLAVSVTTRLIHSDMGSLGEAKAANAAAFDLGAVYQRNIHILNGGYWTVGAQISNWGTKIKYIDNAEALPTSVKAGGSFDVSFLPEHHLMVAVDLGYRLSPSDVQVLNVNAGAEYRLKEHLMLRGGYHYGDKKKGDTSYATAGIGLQYYGIQADFSWLFADEETPLRNSLHFSLGYSF